MSKLFRLSNDRSDVFTTVSGWTIRATGGRWGFGLALLAVVVWAITGPFFRYSENWQLVINTGTTIVTFLMVFLIQNAQNRESKAIHLKLDELIFSIREARNELIDVEHLTQEQLDRLAARYTRVAEDIQRELGDAIDPPAEEPRSEGQPPARSNPHMTVK
jgi:low affinity Fe/Cu permease